MSAHEFSLSSTRVLTMVICSIPLVPPSCRCVALQLEAAGHIYQICCCDRPMTHLCKHQSLISGPIAISSHAGVNPFSMGHRSYEPTQRPAASSLLCHRSNSSPLRQLLRDAGSKVEWKSTSIPSILNVR